MERSHSLLVFNGKHVSCTTSISLCSTPCVRLYSRFSQANKLFPPSSIPSSFARSSIKKKLGRLRFWEYWVAVRVDDWIWNRIRDFDCDRGMGGRGRRGDG